MNKSSCPNTVRDRIVHDFGSNKFRVKSIYLSGFLFLELVDKPSEKFSCLRLSPRHHITALFNFYCSMFCNMVCNFLD